MSTPDKELDNDYQLMRKIDHVLYGEHPSPYSKGDALLMLIHAYAAERERLAIAAYQRDEEQLHIADALRVAGINRETYRRASERNQVR